MIIRAFITALVIGVTVAAAADPVTKTYRGRQQFSIAPGGTLVIDNAVGDVTVTGHDGSQIEAVITRTITGADNDAAAEGRDNTKYLIGGDDRVRIARTVITARTKKWSANVTWQVKLPRTSSVRVLSRASRTIHVKDILGDVLVKNINGTVVLENVSGATVVESANGAIIYSVAQPRSNVRLQTVNGNITATLAANADFRWVADTLKGDIRTTFPARGAFFGTTFRGSINAPGGPTLTTATPMGSISLLAAGTQLAQATSVRRPAAASVVPAPRMVAAGGPSTATPIQRIGSLFKYSTNLGDVRIPEIDGDAEIFTGAGEVQLGAVTGSVRVTSFGGPLQFGEIFGTLQASTRAGDILVDSARRGGNLETTGGTIRVLYTSGPTRLESGGGDIVVRQAAGPIQAETRSGDIAITLDASTKTEKISAITTKGNIVLHVPPRFAANIDAMIETSDANADEILSDIPGLSISKQQIDRGRTRIRATGKLNGGGETVSLRAVGGDIRITTGTAVPSIVAPR